MSDKNKYEIPNDDWEFVSNENYQAEKKPTVIKVVMLGNPDQKATFRENLKSEIEKDSTSWSMADSMDPWDIREQSTKRVILMWDSAGLEKYSSMNTVFAKNTNILLLFTKDQDMYQDFVQKAPEDVVVMVIRPGVEPQVFLDGKLVTAMDLADDSALTILKTAIREYNHVETETHEESKKMPETEHTATSPSKTQRSGGWRGALNRATDILLGRSESVSPMPPPYNPAAFRRSAPPPDARAYAADATTGAREKASMADQSAPPDYTTATGRPGPAAAGPAPSAPPLTPRSSMAPHGVGFEYGGREKGGEEKSAGPSAKR